MAITGKVLAASDLGRGSDEAIRQASAFARRAGSGLVVCHVVPEIFGIRPLLPHLRELDREEADRVRRFAAGILDEQLGRVLGTRAPRPEARIEAGSPHGVILEVAEEIGAGLIVVGRGSDPGSGPSRGVAERVARHASCPVLIASAHEGKSVVAATDFSDPALTAVRLAQEEAERRKLPLVIVHAIDLRATHLKIGEAPSLSLIDRVAEAYREEARERLGELRQRVGPAARLELREGPAVDEILSLAREVQAELIVLGTHGRSGLGRLALGSVAEGVLRRTSISTLVVRLAR